MKIFYSWQTDTPRKINKDFIYGALNRAVGKLNVDLDLDEATREDIQIDQDTQGVLGSPDIVRVILDKIKASNVVVSDVSLVGSGKGGKKHINSNVAIELGYTYGKLGDVALLKVMNTHYGDPADLPFDLRTRRHPVQYCLAPDADAETLAAEQKKLSGTLAGILKLYLEEGIDTSRPEHEEVPRTHLHGAYWATDYPIVPKKPPYVNHDVICTAKSVIYTRLIPEMELPTLSSREAYDASAELWPLLSEGGCSRARNRWGAVSHCIAHDDELMGFSQIFKNREIWGVDCYYAGLWLEEAAKGVSRRYLPTGAMQNHYTRSIESMISTAKKLGYGDQFTIEMGVSGAAGLYLAIDRRYLMNFPGPLFEDEISFRKSIRADMPVGELTNLFWKMLFEEAGTEVPKDLVFEAI